jgi:hypothetical protein
MTRTTNARVAGVAFLVYIAAGISSLVLFGRATRGSGIAERLASLTAHSADVGTLVLLGFVQAFCAIALGVTFYALTRDGDNDLATLGLICRSAEGIIGAVSIPSTLALLQLATSVGGDPSNMAAAQPLAAYLFRNDVALSATFFAVGSSAFCYVFLRHRLVPAPLAWLGVFASVALVAVLPLELAGWARGLITSVVWLPMAVFEVILAIWLITKGVAAAHLRTRE